jgi:hypothetical protein
MLQCEEAWASIHPKRKINPTHRPVKRTALKLNTWIFGLLQNHACGVMCVQLRKVNYWIPAPKIQRWPVYGLMISYLPHKDKFLNQWSVDMSLCGKQNIPRREFGKVFSFKYFFLEYFSRNKDIHVFSILIPLLPPYPMNLKQPLF